MLFIIRCVALTAVLGLAACGGSGGGKSSSSAQVSSQLSSTVTSSSIMTSSSVSSSLLSSSISNSSLESSSAASVVAVQINGTINGFSVEGDAEALDPAKVTVELYLLGDNDQSLASLSPVATAYNNSDELRFNADLSGDNATSLAVTVSYPGYTSYSRKLDAEAQIHLDAKLQAVTEVTVTPAIANSISGLSVDGFNIAVSNEDDTQQSDSISIQIPASLLPEDTESLQVAVRTFDPNDPEDAEFFPGAYADSDGNQLASVAFNFAEINTNTGESLGVAMQKVRQKKIARAGGSQKLLAEEPVIINRQIPTQSCALLESLGDSAPDMPGFQVPVYTYNPNSGLWDLLGQGTLYTEDGQQVPATQTEFDCEADVYYLEILVTNEIFLSDWWNLDYPLTFIQPTEYCALVQVKNPEGQSLSGITGFVMDGDDSFDFASTFFTTDESGQAHIRIAQSSLAPDLEAQAIFFNDAEFGYVTHPVTLSTNCENPEVQVLELARPQMCDLSGHIQYVGGVPANRHLVYGIASEGSSVFGFDFGVTNEVGDYRLSLPCDGSFDLINYAAILSDPDVDYTQKSVIDGNIDPDELSDDGSAVVMETVEVNYVKPIVFGTYDPDANRLELNSFSVFDAFPMTAQVKLTNIGGTVTHDTFNGTFTLTALSDDEELGFYYMGELTRDIELPAVEDGYMVEITITDALGQTWNALPGFVGLPELP